MRSTPLVEATQINVRWVGIFAHIFCYLRNGINVFHLLDPRQLSVLLFTALKYS